MNRLGWRRVVDHTATVVAVGLALLATWPLFSVLWLVFERGWAFVSWDLFSQVRLPASRGHGGLKHALIGSGLVVGLGALIATPIGFLAGTYLSEFGRGRLADGIRTVVNALAGLPSVLAGLFAFILLVQNRGYNARAGGFALAVLALPIITRTTEEALRTVPQSYREAALALGAPRWRTTLTVVAPAAAAPITTGLLLAVARMAGETAPVFLTVLGASLVVTDLDEPIQTLPLLIYQYSLSGNPGLVNLAWAAGLVLLAFILLITSRSVSS